MINRVRSFKYFAKSKLNLKIHELRRLYLAYICQVLIENVKNMHFVNLFYIIYLGQVEATSFGSLYYILRKMIK